MRPILLGLIAIITLGCSTSQVTKARAPEKTSRPNVIIFLCDDVGHGEFGFQGNGEIPTPHIDSIASAGVRFSNGYVSGPYCSPTRAGLMTGRYQTRYGHEFNGGGPAGGWNFGL